MTCLSCWVLGSTWLSPPKRFFGVFPKQFCPHGRWTLIPLVSQFPAVFWANGCCFTKGSVQGSADHSSHLSPTDDASFKFFGGFRQLFFTFISQSLPGVKVVDMSHPCKSSPQKPPIMSLLLGYSLDLFH